MPATDPSGMRLSFTFDPRTDGPVSVYRPTKDPNSPHYGDRRRWLVVSVPWRMPPKVLLGKLAGMVTVEELAEVAAAFGLGEEQG